MFQHATTALALVALLITIPAHAATPLDAVVSLDGFAPSNSATVRLLNASSDVGPVDLYVAQYREAENVAFEEISDAADVSAASFLVRVFPAGETDTPLIETGIVFEQGFERTLGLTGMADDLELVEVVSGTPGTSPNDSYVRFFHASPDAGAMDLAITGGDVLHSDIEFREGSEYVALPGDTYDFEIRAAGEATAVVEIPGVWLQSTRFYTIYLTGLEADEGQPDEEHYYLVPAAARDQGLNDSFFVTDLDLLNYDATAASYQLMWLPRDTDNSDALMSEVLTLAAGQATRHRDVLATVFGFGDDTPAVGALAVVSDSAQLSVFSRTFNQTDDGTFGQGMPGIAASDLIRAGTVKRVMFITEGDDYRSNLGIVNGTSSPITVKWRQFLPDGNVWSTRSVDLPPWGNTQHRRIFEGAEALEAGYVEIWSETHGGAFAAYGSVLDNPTSDPTTVMPQ